MKNIILLIVCFYALNSLARPIEVDVISAEYGVEDHEQKKTLCLTVVRVPQTGALLGVVEGIYDCFYARSAKKSPDHKISIDLKKLKSFQVPELRDHLQTMDTQLKFLFSPGE